MLRTLTPKQINVLTALMSGVTNEEAAKIAGCSLATVERYKADPQFKENMARIGSERLMLVSEMLIESASVAIQTLREVAENPETRANDRIKASDIILSRVESFGEMVNRRRDADLQEVLRIQNEAKTARVMAFKKEKCTLDEEFSTKEHSEENKVLYRQRLKELDSKYSDIIRKT